MCTTHDFSVHRFPSWIVHVGQDIAYGSYDLQYRYDKKYQSIVRLSPYPICRAFHLSRSSLGQENLGCAGIVPCTLLQPKCLRRWCPSPCQVHLKKQHDFLNPRAPLRNLQLCSIPLRVDLTIASVRLAYVNKNRLPKFVLGQNYFEPEIQNLPVHQFVVALPSRPILKAHWQVSVEMCRWLAATKCSLNR